VPQGIHSVLMMQPSVIAATVRYLDTGSFLVPGSPRPPSAPK